jgi:hypothetical protein
MQVMHMHCQVVNNTFAYIKYTTASKQKTIYCICSIYCIKNKQEGTSDYLAVCSIKVPTRCTFYMYFYSSLSLALHVSGAIALILRSTNYSIQL